MLRICGFGLVGAIVAAPVFAQEAPPSGAPTEATESQVPTTSPIIVIGEQEDEQKVIVGSRIPRRQVFNAPGIASSTGTRGLTPGSGMDPAATVRTTRRTECKSPDEQISKQAACLLIDAEAAIDADNLGKARDILAYVTLSEEFTPYEQLAAAKWQYRLAADQDDDASRETALEQMIETGAMPETEALQARRTLISLALRDDRRALARQRLIELDELGAADPQRLANLAILTREQNAGDADAIMLRAIAAREGQNGFVPKGWRDFVKNPAP